MLGEINLALRQPPNEPSPEANVVATYINRHLPMLIFSNNANVPSIIKSTSRIDSPTSRMAVGLRMSEDVMYAGE